jgi:hypothetical protein
VYAYTATNPDELSVEPGQSVSLLEPDDGQGWVKVRSPAGGVGLVPASYLGPPAGGTAVAAQVNGACG